jgi:SAM-dependent methyltransferase
MAPVDDYYTLHADTYHIQTFFLDPSSFLSPLYERLTSGCRILDVGCGSGRDLLWFQRRGFHVIGFERSYPLARLARTHVGCDVIVGDFQQFDFSRFCVDALLLVGALVHTPHGLFQKSLTNVVKAVKPGGFVLLSVKEGQGFSTDAEGRTFFYWTDERLQKILQSCRLVRIHWSRQVSVKSHSDVWLSYVLKKNDAHGRSSFVCKGLQKARSRQDP